MAHLHTCRCGRTHRCDSRDHKSAKWYWCDFKCPDYWSHGTSIVAELDAEFLRFCDEAVEEECG